MEVRRTIRAPAEAVFDAWLDPEGLAAWMRPGDITRSEAEIDPTVGGELTIVMHAPEREILHRGVYREIERGRMGRAGGGRRRGLRPP